MLSFRLHLHFSRQFHGIKRCLDLQILSKQQMSFFEWYFCCICCFSQSCYFFARRVTFPPFYLALPKQRNLLSCCPFFWHYALPLESFSKHPGLVKQGHPTSIFGKYLLGRRYEIQNFQNICCKICCLPASPRTFEHLKNGMAFFTDFYCKKVTQNFRESFFQRKFLKK